MELMQLEMFVAVVEEQSMQKAAERVFRTQPAVSLALAKLEREMGTPLLERKPRRGHRLTRQGELLYEYASQIIGLRNEVSSRLKHDPPANPGRLAIGVTESESLQWISRLAASFSSSNPHTPVEILRAGPDQLVRDLLDRNIDLAFLSCHPGKYHSAAELVTAPLAESVDGKSLWLVERRMGRSHASRVFKQLIHSETSPRAHRAGSTRLRKRAVPIRPLRAQAPLSV
jgi:DNA-binding transcriptional LysR family regulator